MGIEKYENEDTFHGVIKVRGYFRRVSLERHDNRTYFNVICDSIITPIFCSVCNKQAPGLYKHLGSRYGQVGEVECERCHSIIYVTDTDNIVHYLYNSVGQYRNPFTMDVEKFDRHMPTYTFDYAELYFLDINIFNRIEETTGFRFQNEFEINKLVDLADVIEAICSRINENVSTFLQKKYFSDERISHLPDVIHAWFGLLVHLGLLDEKDGEVYLVG